MIAATLPATIHRRYVGCSASAYFLGKCLAHIPLILLSPAVYLTFYYTFSAPRAGIVSYYSVFVLIEVRCDISRMPSPPQRRVSLTGLATTLQFVGTGVGYAVPLLFKGRAQLAGVVFPLICTMFAGVSPDIKALDDMGPVRARAAVSQTSL